MHSLSQSVDVQEAPICIRRYITVAAVEAETLLGNSARRFDNIKFEAALISTGDWFLPCSPSACWDRGRSALSFIFKYIVEGVDEDRYLRMDT